MLVKKFMRNIQILLLSIAIALAINAIALCVIGYFIVNALGRFYFDGSYNSYLKGIEYEIYNYDYSDELEGIEYELKRLNNKR